MSRAMQIVVIQGSQKGQTLLVRVDESVIIGRSKKCELQIHDRQVSRRHCRIEGSAEGFRCIDLGSGNGCLLNRDRIKTALLKHKDQLQLGRTVLSFRFPKRPARSRPARHPLPPAPPISEETEHDEPVSQERVATVRAPQVAPAQPVGADRSAGVEKQTKSPETMLKPRPVVVRPPASSKPRAPKADVAPVSTVRTPESPARVGPRRAVQPAEARPQQREVPERLAGVALPALAAMPPPPRQPTDKLTEAAAAAVRAVDGPVRTPFLPQVSQTPNAEHLDPLLLRKRGRRAKVPQHPSLYTYEALNRLDEGPLGVLYRARHRTSGKVFAVRALPMRAASAGLLLEAWQPIVDFAAWKGVAHIHEILAFRNQVLIVSDSVRGRDLHRLIRKLRLMPDENALVVLRGLARALLQASRAGQWHGCLHPGAVLLDEKQRPTVIDFSLHRLAPAEVSLPLPDNIEPYLPPECRDPCRPTADPRGDVYSLCALACFLFTGGPPPLEAVPADVFPVELRSLLKAGLNQKPNRRPGFLDLIRVMECASERVFRNSDTVLDLGPFDEFS